MRYSATLGKSSMIITFLVGVFFLALIGLGIGYIRGHDGKPIPLYTSIVCIAIYTIAYAFRVLGYVLTIDELIIQRPLFNVYIPLKDIRDGGMVDQHIKAIRIAGVGGLFGYWGTFASFSKGFMTWYVTRKDRLVMIVMKNNKKILISPDDAAGFVQELKEKLA